MGDWTWALRLCDYGAMYDQPYLETCCRSALHRLTLCGPVGRPPGLKDGPCLHRLAGLGFARHRPDGRFEITSDGTLRHSLEIAPCATPETAIG